MSTMDPKTGLYWQAQSAEDAYYISLGRPDLAPGAYLTQPPAKPVAVQEPAVDYRVLNPRDGFRYYAQDAESAYYISLGRPDLA